jgi:26S proteasome regulatory subunit N5
MEEDPLDLIKPLKMEKDCSELVDAQLPETTLLAQSGKLLEALEQLQILEKQARVAADLASTSRVLIHVVKLCFESQDWKSLNEQIVLYSKKRGQLKQAIICMVQEAMACLEKTPTKEVKMSLLETLMQVTEGKIYVEIEGARLTRMLAKIREDEGKIAEAADILQRLQVETFGSMEKREKVDFILEQMRLLIAKNDFIRTQLVSKKISTKFFDKDEFSDLKLRYYELMIQYGEHEELYLDVCKYYYEIYQTKSIQESDSWREAFKNIIIYAILSPFNNEQSDLVNRINQDKKLEGLPLFKSFLKNFLTQELIDWTDLENKYKKEITSVPCVGVQNSNREGHWKVVRDRAIEHNIRVVAKYYSRVKLDRLSQLLSLSPKETEEYVSKMVVSKTIFGRINRPAGIVTFAAKKDPNDILNTWSSSITSLLSLIEKSTHLITKEEMVHQIAEVK